MLNALHLAPSLVVPCRAIRTARNHEGRQGYHPPRPHGGQRERTTLTFIIRDHELAGLAAMGQRLRGLCRASADRATRPHLLRHTAAVPQHGLLAEEGYDVRQPGQRGHAVPSVWSHTRRPHAAAQTARASPSAACSTPNMFCGGHNIHGPLEWVAVQDMARSMEVCVALVQEWVG